MNYNKKIVIILIAICIVIFKLNEYAYSIQQDKAELNPYSNMNFNIQETSALGIAIPDTETTSGLSLVMPDTETTSGPSIILPDTETTSGPGIAIPDTETTSGPSLTIPLSNRIDQFYWIDKTKDSITLEWNLVKDAVGYEILFNNKVIQTEFNTYKVTGLVEDKTYVFRVRPIFNNDQGLLSNPLSVKIIKKDPKTNYAAEFLKDSEEQEWFIDTVENILNLKGKSVNTIESREDLANIFTIRLNNRNINGKIPRAIGELYNLEYLYLSNNHLNEELPDELFTLKNIKNIDLSNNNFSSTISNFSNLSHL